MADRDSQQSKRKHESDTESTTMKKSRSIITLEQPEAIPFEEQRRINVAKWLIELSGSVSTERTAPSHIGTSGETSTLDETILANSSDQLAAVEALMTMRSRARIAAMGIRRKRPAKFPRRRKIRATLTSPLDLTNRRVTRSLSAALSASEESEVYPRIAQRHSTIELRPIRQTRSNGANHEDGSASSSISHTFLGFDNEGCAVYQTKDDHLVTESKTNCDLP